MPYRTDVIYHYDGTFEGLMTVVFECYNRRDFPQEIITDKQCQLSLCETVDIPTNPQSAERVLTAISQKICHDALETVQKGFLTFHPRKEILITRFLFLGFKYGRKVMGMFANDMVNELFKAINHLSREVQLFKGFVRFSISDNVLTAKIAPKNYVLPLIAPHFAERYRNEQFLIYDETHKMALIYQNHRVEIIGVDSIELPKVDETELFYRALWRKFHSTIEIQQRHNPLCQMTMMPKRFWGNMTEFSNDSDANFLISEK